MDWTQKEELSAVGRLKTNDAKIDGHSNCHFGWTTPWWAWAPFTKCKRLLFDDSQPQ